MAAPGPPSQDGSTPSWAENAKACTYVLADQQTGCPALADRQQTTLERGSIRLGDTFILGG
jgi:hypothetical protein